MITKYKLFENSGNSKFKVGDRVKANWGQEKDGVITRIHTDEFTLETLITMRSGNGLDYEGG